MVARSLCCIRAVRKDMAREGRQERELWTTIAKSGLVEQPGAPTITQKDSLHGFYSC